MNFIGNSFTFYRDKEAYKTPTNIHTYLNLTLKLESFNKGNNDLLLVIKEIKNAEQKIKFNIRAKHLN